MTTRRTSYLTAGGLAILMAGLFAAGFLLNARHYRFALNSAEGAVEKTLDERRNLLLSHLEREENRAFALVGQDRLFEADLFILQEGRFLPDILAKWRLHTEPHANANTAFKKGVELLPSEKALPFFETAARALPDQQVNWYQKISALFNVLDFRPDLEVVNQILFALNQSGKALPESQKLFFRAMLTDLDGFSVLSNLRKTGNQTPAIFLTARSTEADKLRGLGLGADDYVVKPFSILELVARVKAVLKRTCPGAEIQTLEIGHATVDFSKQTITTDAKSEKLGRYEADILRLLASEPGRIFSRDEILNTVWGMETFPSNRTIDNQIVKLRQKLEPAPKQPRHVLSIYGKGYKLVLAR